jgi:DNA-binding PadR family transcriptional regulator
MTVRMVILGLLRDRPLYGYEIKQIIEEHMNDWTSIAFGSIYFALDKLAEEKFVEKISIEKDGNRPSRSVYQITYTGREEFLRLLRENWQTVERQYFSIDICLFFLESLELSEVKKYLYNRQNVLQYTDNYIQKHHEEQLDNPDVPPLADAIFNHAMLHNQAELEWVSGLIKKIENGSFP